MWVCFSNLCFLIFSVVHCSPLASSASPLCSQHKLHTVLPGPLWGFEHSPHPPLSEKEEQASTWLEYQVLQYGWLQGTLGKLEMGVCVLSICEIVQACVWIIAQRLFAMQWINVALCQATANISLPCSHFSHPFYPPFSFCLAHLTPRIHLTGKYDSF